MASKLMALKPHIISKDLNAHMLYIYGEAGVGKTTFGVSAPKALLLAGERGYDALGGENVIPYDIFSWADMKTAIRELKTDKEVKETFKMVVLDTIDELSAMCEKYICGQLGINSIGEGGWQKNGWAKVKKEWADMINEIHKSGYGMIFISHAKEKTFKNKDGSEYTKIAPSCSSVYSDIVRNAVTLQGYAYNENGEPKIIFRSDDDTVECKSHFKYLEKELPFSYASVSKAIANAIKAEEENLGKEFVTDELPNYNKPEFDYDALMKEFNEIVSDLSKNHSEDEFKEVYQPQIRKIVAEALGDPNKKASQCTPQQVEQLAYIVTQLRDLK